jgi:hypothetical protein
MAVSRILVGWLLLALVAVQTLGQMHRVVHAPAVVAGHAHEVHVHHDHGHGVDWTAGLFAGHNETPDCRLFDQLTHGDTLGCAAAPALPMALPVALLAFSQGEALARRAALFEARGPPFFR